MHTISLPSPVADALGSLVPELAARGVLLSHFEVSGSFGNFEATFSRGSLTFSLVRDRGQFHVGVAERCVLEAAGLWRSFSGANSLAAPLLAWLDSHNAD